MGAHAAGHFYGQSWPLNRRLPSIIRLISPSFADIAADSQRDFLQSHPWLRFSIDLRPGSRQLWQLLGEARSKCRHLLLTPLKPAVAHELEKVYLAKGMQATTAIEGNTLTLDQVRQAIDGTLALAPSQQYLGREVDNVLQACRQVEQVVAQSEGFEITPALLKQLNASVLADLDVDDHVEPGAYRDVAVTVGAYRAVPAADVEFLMALLCDWLNTEFESEDHADAFLMAFVKAIAAHVYIAWIHPFGDGNGRTARLLELGILTAAGIPSVAAHLLSNHYNLTRSAYYRQLETASRSGGDLCPFIAYAAEGFVDLLQEELDRVHQEVFDIAWENYVHETFSHRSGDAAKRQRDLVIALGRHGDPTARDRISSLTPALAASYAAKQSKTLTRDLNKIASTGLVERLPNGSMRAKREIMFGFTPRIGGDVRKNVLVDMAHVAAAEVPPGHRRTTARSARP